MRIQSRVLGVPDNTTVELISSGSGLYLELSAPTSQFGVHWRQNHSHLTNQIWIDGGCRLQTCRPPPARYRNTIALHVDIARGHARKFRIIGTENVVLRHIHTSHDPDKVQDVVADQRQVDDLLLFQHVADRGARFEQKLICGDTDFNICCDLTDLQCKVQAYLGRVSQLDVVECLRLECRK